MILRLAIAFILALLCFGPSVLSRDFGTFLLSLLVLKLLLVLPGLWFILGICLQKGGRRLSHFVALTVLIGTAGYLQSYDHAKGGDLADRIRWKAQSDEFRRQMEELPRSDDTLPHLVWDCWGFGDSTRAYLVYDVSDTLLTPPYQPRRGSIPGIKCPASDVRRLEAQWYIVTLYTDTDWDHCEGG